MVAAATAAAMALVVAGTGSPIVVVGEACRLGGVISIDWPTAVRYPRVFRT
jgi:hypothetical protein